MKKFYAFAAIAVLAAAAPGGVSAKSPAEIRAALKVPHIASPREFRAAAEEEVKSVWGAATRHLYSYEEDQWVLEETYKTKYYPNGMEEVVDIISEDGILRETLKYNEVGYMTYRLREVSEDNGATFTPSELLEREFDPIIKTLPVKAVTKMFMNGQWVETGSSYTRTITRNADGNITSVEIAVPYEGKYDPTERYLVEYGEDGKANRFEYVKLVNYGETMEWESQMVYSDIVWDSFDGQIYNTESLTYGANRIASATITQFGSDTQMKASYQIDDQGLGSFSVELFQDYGGGLTWKDVTTTYLEDIYGSYRSLEQTEITFPAEEEGQEPMTDVMKESEHYVVNEFGLEMLIYSIMAAGDEIMVMENMKADLETDPVYGYPLTYIRKIAPEETPDAIPSVPEIKIEFADYYDVAGLRAIAPADNADAPVRYFDLSGRAVAKPANGIFIRQQGSKAEKILVK